MDPKDAHIYTNKGLALKNLGRNDDAIKCYYKAIDLDPSEVHARINLGSLLISLDRHDESLKLLD